MFDRFGEFDSAKELNAAAEGQKEQGDLEALIDLAAENGIDKADAQDYFDGIVDELATPLMAAMGKLEVEAKEMKVYEIMEDWLMYIRTRCSEEPKMASAVRRKGKTLKGCIAAMLKWSFSHQYDVPKEIIKEAGISAGRCTLGIPGMKQARKLIDEYYLGGK